MNLLAAGAKVVAVEFDKSLAGELQDKFAGKDFELRLENILTFDFGSLPKCYKIVANIPYYLTSHLFRIICETTNIVARAVLLVQKEVAERVTATPGEMSLLAVSVQTYGQVSLGEIVPAKLFSPPPKVDSRVLIIDFYDKPLVGDTIQFFGLSKPVFPNPERSYAAPWRAVYAYHRQSSTSCCSQPILTRLAELKRCRLKNGRNSANS